eukprot:3074497-Pyramimonas_sp.AAC.1
MSVRGVCRGTRSQGRAGGRSLSQTLVREPCAHGGGTSRASPPSLCHNLNVVQNMVGTLKSQLSPNTALRDKGKIHTSSEIQTTSHVSQVKSYGYVTRNMGRGLLRTLAAFPPG